MYIYIYTYVYTCMQTRHVRTYDISQYVSHADPTPKFSSVRPEAGLCVPQLARGPARSAEWWPVAVVWQCVASLTNWWSIHLFWLEIVQLELHTCFSKGAGSGWFRLVPVLNFSATHSFLGLRVHRSVWSVDFPQIWHLGYLSCSDSSWSKPFKFVVCPISSDTEELDTVNFPLSWVEQWLQGPWRKGSRAMTRTRLSCKLSSSNDVPSLRILPRMALMRFVIFMK